MYASDYRRIARDRLAGNWLTSVLVTLVAALLGGMVASSGSFSINLNLENLAPYIDEEAIQLILPTIIAFTSALSTLSYAQFVLGGVVRVGHAQYLLHQYDRTEELHIKTLFSKFDIFLKAFLLQLLTNLFIVLWTLLFVIPGIVKAYSYAMAPFIMAENPEISPKDAITASRQLMDGHKWELFCLNFSFIGWALLSGLTLGIGTLFLNPYTNAAYAAFYRRLVANNTAGHTTVVE